MTRNFFGRTATIAIMLIAVLTGCRQFSLFDDLGGSVKSAPEDAVQIAPVSVSVPAGGRVTFTALGGLSPYIYSITSGSGSIDAATGEYLAPPSPGTGQITVTDALGKTSSATVTVTSTNGPLLISPLTVTLATNNSMTFIAGGGSGSYAFMIDSSGSLGASITPAGLYTAGSTAGTDVVRVTDTVSTDFVTATVTVSTVVTNVDYRIDEPIALSPIVKAGGSFSGDMSFTITNIGSADGNFPIEYQVFLSDDGTFGSGDTIISQGSIGQLPKLTTSAAEVPMGTWPSRSGSYSVFVRIISEDDLVTVNNRTAAAALTIEPRDVDYFVTASVMGGTRGVGSVLSESFTLDNVGLDNGTEDVLWAAYLSKGDVNIVDPGDILVDSGTVAGGMTSAQTPLLIPLSGSWPLETGTDWYLVIRAVADDEVNELDNEIGVGPIEVVQTDINYLVNTVSAVTPAKSGEPIAATFRYENDGTVTGTSPVSWRAYLSTDEAIGTGDTLIATGTVPGLAPEVSGDIPISGGFWPIVSVTTDYYIGVVLKSPEENDPLDNEGFGAAVAVDPRNVDYEVTAVSSTGSLNAGGTLTGQFTVHNRGTDTGAAGLNWIVYVSSDDTFALASDPVAAAGVYPAVGGGLTANVPFSGLWPAAAGDYWLFVAIDAADDLNPANDAGDHLPNPYTTSVVDVNYAVSGVENTGGTAAGGAITGRFDLQNIGSASGTAPVNWTAYYSPSSTLDASATPIDFGTEIPLGSLASYSNIPITGTWPHDDSVPYYLIVKVIVGEDADGSNDEASSAPVTVTAPNYTVDSVVHVSGETVGGTVTWNMAIKNNGSGTGSAPVYWTAYASTDTTVDVGSDSVIAEGSAVGPAGFGATVNLNGLTGTWPTVSASYYILVTVRADDEPPVYRGDNSGWTALPVAVTPPNVEYIVESVNHLSGTTAGRNFTAEFSLRNLGMHAGSYSVEWRAYISSDMNYNPGLDPLVDADSETALNGLSVRSNIPISGTWPDEPGNSYYIIVIISAADDLTALGNESSTTVPVTLIAANVSYSFQSGPASATVDAGSPINESFVIRNVGTENGADPVYWKAWVSKSDTVIDAFDILVDSGFIGALNASQSSAPIPIEHGSWPTVPDTDYYLIIEIISGEDIDTSDNQFDVNFILTAPPPVNYRVSFVSGIDSYGIIGNPVTGTQTRIRIENVSANNGIDAVYWAIYASTDMALDAGDLELDSGNMASLDSGIGVDVDFNASWLVPSGGNYYLIAAIDADDDSVMKDNGAVSIPIAVGNYFYVEGAEDNSGTGPTPPAISPFSETGTTLGVGETLVISGTMDAYEQYDTYRFVAGTGMTGVSIRCVWFTGFDDIDIYLWDTDKNEVTSIDTASDAEPASGTLDVINMLPGGTYFVSANFWLGGGTSGSTGENYVIFVTGNP